MKIIGLTGSIAAGKSTVAGWINELGIVTHDSDRAVHELLGPGGRAVKDVLKNFGSHLGSVSIGVDRILLGDEVFAAPQKRKTLESILHPMLRQHRDSFIAQHLKSNAEVVVLDVPLLFETGADAICDYVIVVYASDKTIARRALTRTGMTKDKLASILAAQMPTIDKKKLADLALDSDIPKDETRNHLIGWLSEIGLSIIRGESG
jgi:dephospho-CoA kinase